MHYMVYKEGTEKITAVQEEVSCMHTLGFYIPISYKKAQFVFLCAAWQQLHEPSAHR